eukprot:scaffold631690_cov20-Prasinocladus_malaysianus.AAC.1
MLIPIVELFELCPFRAHATALGHSHKIIEMGSSARDFILVVTSKWQSKPICHSRYYLDTQHMYDKLKGKEIRKGM